MHTEGDAGAAEAERVEQGLQETKEAALDETHGGCGYRARYVVVCMRESK